MIKDEMSRVETLCRELSQYKIALEDCKASKLEFMKQQNVSIIFQDQDPKQFFKIDNDGFHFEDWLTVDEAASRFIECLEPHVDAIKVAAYKKAVNDVSEYVGLNLMSPKEYEGAIKAKFL